MGQHQLIRYGEKVSTWNFKGIFHYFVSATENNS